MALSTISGTTGITDATITSVKLADFAAAVDLNGVELILDADQDTSITADTDDRIDFKIAGVEHISISNSSGDTVIKPMVDAKDIVFQQYDGNKILEINDGNYVAISGAAAGPGELRFYEDTDLGSHYTGFKAGNATASVSYVLPLADGTDGYQLSTDGSGTLSWAASGVTLANDGNNRVVTGTGSGLNGEANLTFDGSTLAVTGAATVSGALTGSSTVQGTTITATTAFVPDASDGAALGTSALEFSDLFLADAAVISLGDDDDVTITHVADTGILINSTNVIQFNDASQNIGAPSNAILDINATDEIELNATLVDINANVEISGTATTTGVHTFTAVPVFPNDTIETADIQADAITAAKIADNAVVTAGINADAITAAKIADNAVVTAGINADAVTNAKIADNAIDSEHYTDGSIDNEHIADDAINSEHYAAASIDNAHIADGAVDTQEIADNAITLAKMAAGTDGNLITYDASGDPAYVTTGSDGQVLTSTGSGSAPAFEANIGSWKLLQTQTASTDSTITFSSTYITTAHDIYKIMIHSLLSSSDADAIRISAALDNSTFNLQGNGALSAFITDETNFTVATGQPNAAGSIAIASSISDTATEAGFNTEITIYSPMTNTETIVTLKNGQQDSDDKYRHEDGVIHFNQGAINAFRFGCNSGTTTGKFSLYGLVK